MLSVWLLSLLLVLCALVGVWVCELVDVCWRGGCVTVWIVGWCGAFRMCVLLWLCCGVGVFGVWYGHYGSVPVFGCAEASLHRALGSFEGLVRLLGS